MKVRCLLAAICVSLPISSAVGPERPASTEAPDAPAIATYHAEGAVIYECGLDADHQVWRPPEPVASLIDTGATAGRALAGPTWEHKDGSMVRAKVVGSAPGATAEDLPWLRLDVEVQLNDGALYGVSNVQ